MRRWVIYLWFGLAAAGHCAGREVVFEGGRPVNATELERAGAQGRVAADSLEASMRARGYLEAKVEVQGDRLVVTAGERARLVEVAVAAGGGETVVKRVDYPFTEEAVSRVVDSVLAVRRDDGHYYASVTIDSIGRCHDDIKIHLNIVPGPVMRLGEVEYLGVRWVRPGDLARCLSVRSGDTLTDGYLERLERAAADIPWVRFYPPVTVRPHTGFTGADLELQFAEERLLQLDLGGGYIPDATTAAFVWHVDARLNNIFGGGRRASLLSERREEDREILKVSYAQPLFFAGMAEGRIEVATRDYRESFYEFALSAGYENRFPEGFAAGVAAGYRSVEPAGAAADYDAYTILVSGQWDRVDDPLNPANGFEARTMIGYTHRRYGSDTASEITSQFNETRTEFEGRLYRRLVGPVVGHLRIGYRGLETSEDLPPLAELNLIGGPGTVRGYRNEQFAVLRAALLTLEPRVRFGSGYLFGFYDGAYVSNREQGGEGVRTRESYHSGFGFGVSLRDDFRAVTLALGWNPETAYDEPRLTIQLTSGF